MMMNLFSMFDPFTGLLFSNWMIIIFFLMWPNFWFIQNMLIVSMKLIILNLKDLNKLIYDKKLLIIPLLFLIFFSNFYSQWPYIFSISSHLSFTMSLGLPFWLLSMLNYMSLNKFFYSLIPLSTPLYLMSFMILIELMSIIIRPMTLSVRLMANMLAGHLMMKFISSMNMWLTSYFIELIYLLLEIFISFIQAYIFILLILLYNQN